MKRSSLSLRQVASLLRLASYGSAALLGLASVLFVFPGWHRLWRLPPGAPRSADFAQHVIGGRYFLNDGWHPDVLIARGLDAPFGAHVGMTDSLPLFLLLLKPFAALLPSDFQPVTGGLAICWLLQPVAAVFLLRSMNERRLLPALAVATFAIATPTLLMRLDHEALSAHFTLLLAAGLSLRIVDTARGRSMAILAAPMLLVAVLFIHPYLLVMAGALLLAAPLTLLLRRDSRWITAALCLAAGFSVTAGLAAGLGYLGQGGMIEGFGVYSMNVLSPVWPFASRAFNGAGLPQLDATGGQYEGYQYVGIGLASAIAIALMNFGRRFLRLAGWHSGLLLACVVLTGLALSSRVYLGHLLVATWPAPDFLGLVRASGRLFWPVVYLAQALSVAALACLNRRVAVPLLVTLPLLQLYDASDLLRRQRWAQNQVAPLPFDEDRLLRAIAANDHLVVLPPWPCEATEAGVVHLMNVLYVATRTLVQTNTMYTARLTHPPRCDLAASMRQPLLPGELRVLLPGHAALANQLVGAADRCRSLGPLTLCSISDGHLEGLPLLTPRVIEGNEGH